MKELFGHEKLTVYQDSILFAVWAGELLETLPKNLAGLIRSTSADRTREEQAGYEDDNRGLAD